METDITKTPTKKRNHPSSLPEDNEITDNRRFEEDRV